MSSRPQIMDPISVVYNGRMGGGFVFTGKYTGISYRVPGREQVFVMDNRDFGSSCNMLGGELRRVE